MDMRRAAHAKRRNAEVKRGCSLPSRDASVGFEIVGETHDNRLVSWDWWRERAKACMPRASTNVGIWDRRAHGHAVPYKKAFRCCATRAKNTFRYKIREFARDTRSGLAQCGKEGK
ncbi:UNVERIFIED_CONTAM: hypothetical protein Sindi_0427100 [Sesamum indicum]